MSETIDWAWLAEPFAADEIEWRVGNRSKRGDTATLLCYLTSRAVQDRLDQVVGPARWRDRYTPIVEGQKTIGFLCTLEIEVSEGVWVAKTDVADTTDIERLKGGISGALKRAAVKWGIGRYLYGIDSRYHRIVEGYGPDNAVYCPIGDQKKPGHIVPPQLPAWALPGRRSPAAARPPAEPAAPEAAPPAPAPEKHPSWKADQPRFFAALNDKDAALGISYEGLAEWCVEVKGWARPSGMDQRARTALINALRKPENAAKVREWIAAREAK